jgi:hypothetical protein
MLAVFPWFSCASMLNLFSVFSFILRFQSFDLLACAGVFALQFACLSLLDDFSNEAVRKSPLGFSL